MLTEWCVSSRCFACWRYCLALMRFSRASGAPPFPPYTLVLTAPAVISRCRFPPPLHQDTCEIFPGKIPASKRALRCGMCSAFNRLFSASFISEEVNIWYKSDERRDVRAVYCVLVSLPSGAWSRPVYVEPPGLPGRPEYSAVSNSHLSALNNRLPKVTALMSICVTLNH